MGGGSTIERRAGIELSGRDWYRRFNELYNASAGTLLTELGLFYDRHRKFVEYGQRSDPDHPEYTDEEWDRVMTALLAQLAGEMGLVQASDSEGREQLEWFLPGVTDRPLVVVRATSDATKAILHRDLVELSRTGADLSVFLMYPDYPRPEGSSTFDEAACAWQQRIEQRLTELRPQGQVLTLMISAYSFELPAPWRGFLWDPAAGALKGAA